MTPRNALYLSALAATAAVGGCTDVPTDPGTPVAIEVEQTQLPAIVIGDSLRDSTGAVVSLGARALNSRNQVIPEAPVRFAVLRGDTGVISVDSLTGRVYGRKPGEVTVTASIGALQAGIPVRVTLRPDTLVRLDSLVDTLVYQPLRDTTLSLGVFLGQADTTSAGADTLLPVPWYLVRFRIMNPEFAEVAPTDSTRVFLADDLRRPSRLDTTSATSVPLGMASRRVRITVAAANNPSAPPPDSLLVEVSAMMPDMVTPVPGSPVRYVVHLRRRTP